MELELTATGTVLYISIQTALLQVNGYHLSSSTSHNTPRTLPYSLRKLVGCRSLSSFQE